MSQVLMCYSFRILAESGHGFEIGWIKGYSIEDATLNFKTEHSDRTSFDDLSLTHVGTWDYFQRRMAHNCD